MKETAVLQIRGENAKAFLFMMIRMKQKIITAAGMTSAGIKMPTVL